MDSFNNVHKNNCASSRYRNARRVTMPYNKNSSLLNRLKQTVTDYLKPPSWIQNIICGDPMEQTEMAAKALSPAIDNIITETCENVSPETSHFNLPAQSTENNMKTDRESYYNYKKEQSENVVNCESDKTMKEDLKGLSDMSKIKKPDYFSLAVRSVMAEKNQSSKNIFYTRSNNYIPSFSNSYASSSSCSKSEKKPDDNKFNYLQDNGTNEIRQFNRLSTTKVQVYNNNLAMADDTNDTRIKSIRDINNQSNSLINGVSLYCNDEIKGHSSNKSKSFFRETNELLKYYDSKDNEEKDELSDEGVVLKNICDQYKNDETVNTNSQFKSSRILSDSSFGHTASNIGHTSTFYNGPTTYGGAMSYQKIRPKPRDFQGDSSKKLLDKSVTRTRSKVYLSSTAQKILKLLEQKDSDSCVNKSSVQLPISHNPGILKRMKFDGNAIINNNVFTPTSSKQQGPPIKTLQIASKAILRPNYPTRDSSILLNSSDQAQLKNASFEINGSQKSSQLKEGDYSRDHDNSERAKIVSNFEKVLPPPNKEGLWNADRQSEKGNQLKIVNQFGNDNKWNGKIKREREIFHIDTTVDQHFSQNQDTDKLSNIKLPDMKKFFTNYNQPLFSLNAISNNTNNNKNNNNDKNNINSANNTTSTNNLTSITNCIASKINTNSINTSISLNQINIINCISMNNIGSTNSSINNNNIRGSIDSLKMLFSKPGKLEDTRRYNLDHKFNDLQWSKMGFDFCNPAELTLRSRMVRTSLGEFKVDFTSAIKKDKVISDKVLPRAKSIREGSAMDILKPNINNNFITSTPLNQDKECSNGILKDLFKKSLQSSVGCSDTWKCSECFVENNPATTDTCQCCTSRRPLNIIIDRNKKTAEYQPVVSNHLPSLSSLFAPSLGEWTCDICMVKNKKDSLACVACETSKPGAETTSKDVITSKSSIEINPIGGGFKFGANNFMTNFFASPVVTADKTMTFGNSDFKSFGNSGNNAFNNNSDFESFGNSGNKTSNNSVISSGFKSNFISMDVGGFKFGTSYQNIPSNTPVTIKTFGRVVLTKDSEIPEKNSFSSLNNKEDKEKMNLFSAVSGSNKIGSDITDDEQKKKIIFVTNDNSDKSLPLTTTKNIGLFSKKINNERSLADSTSLIDKLVSCDSENKYKASSSSTFSIINKAISSSKPEYHQINVSNNNFLLTNKTESDMNVIKMSTTIDNNNTSNILTKENIIKPTTSLVTFKFGEPPIIDNIGQRQIKSSIEVEGVKSGNKETTAVVNKSVSFFGTTNAIKNNINTTSQGGFKFGAAQFNVSAGNAAVKTTGFGSIMPSLFSFGSSSTANITTQSVANSALNFQNPVKQQLFSGTNSNLKEETGKDNNINTLFSHHKPNENNQYKESLYSKQPTITSNSTNKEILFGNPNKNESLFKNPYNSNDLMQRNDSTAANKEIIFGNQSNNSTNRELIFGNPLNKQKDSLFSSIPPIKKDLLFVSAAGNNELEFGRVTNKNNDSKNLLFINANSKESIFGNQKQELNNKGLIFGSQLKLDNKHLIFGSSSNTDNSNNNGNNMLFANSNNNKETLFSNQLETTTNNKDSLFSSTSTNKGFIFSSQLCPSGQISTDKLSIFGNPKDSTNPMLKSGNNPFVKQFQFGNQNEELASAPSSTTSSARGSNLFQFGSNLKQSSQESEMSQQDADSNVMKTMFSSQSMFSFNPVASKSTNSFQFATTQISNPGFNFGGSGIFGQQQLPSLQTNSYAGQQPTFGTLNSNVQSTSSVFAFNATSTSNFANNQTTFGVIDINKPANNPFDAVYNQGVRVIKKAARRTLKK